MSLPAGIEQPLNVPAATPPAVEGGDGRGGHPAPVAAGIPITFVVYGTPAPQGSKRHVGKGVMIESSKDVKPWRQDVVAAAKDELPSETDIDRLWPRLGPCLLCGSGADARHRMMDAVAGCVFAGDGPDYVANDYGVSVEAVNIAVAAALYPLDGPLVARMVFTLRKPASAPKRRRTWPDRTPDLSKLARSTEDALTTAGLWADDARVVEYERLAKVYPGEDPEALDSPGVRISVRKVTA